MALKKIFFQSSLPRSGSTYMQCVLASNPNIYAGGTDGCLELLFGARGNYQTSPEFKAQDATLMKGAFKDFCRAGLEAYSSALIKDTDKEYVVLKSRGWGVYRDFLNEFYPDPKIICMIRDLRDVFCSYEKLYRKNQLAGDPIRNDAEARGTTVYKRMDEWAHPQNTIGRAIERLTEIIALGYANKILFVKYEDFCLRPETEMTRIYQYLGIPYYAHDFDNIPQTVKEEDTVFGMGDLHTIRPKLKMLPSDAKSVLGNDVCKWITGNAPQGGGFGWFYDYFKYQR